MPRSTWRPRRWGLLLKANFDPNQPRVPGGVPAGGQWTRAEGYAPEGILEEPAFESPEARGRRRRVFVLRGSGSRFRVAPNPDADPTKPLGELSFFSQVSDYANEIEQVAKEVGVDADLIRAIMYLETTHGYYGIPADIFSVSNSVLPMNINLSVWGEVFGGRTKLNVPLDNIRAGATILRGIVRNLPPSASVAQIATLYNLLSATKVTDYGARAEAIYKARLWDR